MAKNFIVGTGFAGMLAYLLMGKDAQVIGSDGKILPQYQNTSFTYNKILGLKSRSYTKLFSMLKRIELHDRLVQGGNGTIWGGFFNTDSLLTEQLDILKSVNISLAPLSYARTGSASPNKSICQLHYPCGDTLNPAAIIKDIRSAYLETFEVLKNTSIELRLQNPEMPSQLSVEILNCNQLVLAVGVVQLIDLLYRSSYLKEGDILELSEFKYSLGLVLKKSQVNKAAQVIRINILRGLLHHLGIQRYPKIIEMIDRFIPFVFEQAFYYEKFSSSLVIQHGSLIELDQGEIMKFGASIHYCNLKINGVPAGDFLNNISPSIIGLGMAFVDQKVPGPISNDIFIDTLKKIRREK